MLYKLVSSFIGLYLFITFKWLLSVAGPALVHLNFQSCLGRGVMIQYVLPVEKNLQKLVHVFYTSRTWIAPYAKVILMRVSLFNRLKSDYHYLSNHLYPRLCYLVSLFWWRETSEFGITKHMLINLSTWKRTNSYCSIESKNCSSF